MRNAIGMGIVLALLLTGLPALADGHGALAFEIKDRNNRSAGVQGFEAWRLELHSRVAVPAIDVMRDRSRVVVPWADIRGLRRVAAGRWELMLISGESFVCRIERDNRLHFGGWQHTAHRWARYYVPIEKVSVLWRINNTMDVPPPLPREDNDDVVYKAIVQLDNGDSLTGDMLTKSFTVQTSYGEIALSLDEIAMITFAQNEDQIESVLLINGDRLSGVLMPASFTLGLAGGQQLDLMKSQAREIRF